MAVKGHSSTAVSLPFPSLPPPADDYEGKVAVSPNQYMYAPRGLQFNPPPPVPVVPPPLAFWTFFTHNFSVLDDHVGFYPPPPPPFLNRRTPVENSTQPKSR